MANYEKFYVDKETFNMLPRMIEIYKYYHPEIEEVKLSAGFIVKKAFIKIIEDENHV